MILLTTIKHPRYAQAFVDYLTFLGIETEVKMVPDGQVIYLVDNSKLPAAQRELMQFLAEPNNERYLQASWEVEEDRAAEARMARIYRSPSLIHSILNNGIVTKSVFVICLFIFLYTGEGMKDKAIEPFLFFASVDVLANSHQYWRWLTPALLHFGWLHFSMNMSCWWIFGGAIERTQSSLRLLGIALTCAWLGNVLQFMFTLNQFGGLSGVVYGLLGYLIVYGKVNPESAVRLPPGMLIFLLLTLAFGFTNIIPIANAAHVGGLVSGALLGWVLAKLDMAEHR